ncbi:MAG: ABC transporter permease [Kiritimatiellae bacterium]|nr:ABC transporter permease [Kiritimatiellia bacterium]
MRAFLIIWRKELAAYFLSPIAYVVTIFFLVVMGFSFWLLVNVLAQGAAGLSVMGELFGSLFFWITLLVVVPVITMRLLAEEQRSGTIETLMTAPVRDIEVVLGKYAGALSFYLVMWMPTAAYAFVLKAFAPLAAPIDLGPMLGGYLGALLVGAFYLSIGVFTSALTRNQIVAAIACFALACVAFFIGFLPYVSHSEIVRTIGEQVSSVGYMLEFSRGIVDTRPIVFHLTGTVFMLFAAIRVVEARKWK